MASLRERIGRIKTLVDEVKKDCKDLKSKGELSERGKGQLNLAARIEEILNA